MTESKGKISSVLVLAFLSSIASVVYEVLYFRKITTHLGDMYYVHVTLLSVFLLGLGLGAFWTHRVLRKVYVLEGLTGLYAILFPWTLWAYTSIDLSVFIGGQIYVVFSSALLLFVPAVCIGVTVPAFSALLQSSEGEGEGFGRTYLWYNLGASLGVLFAEFYLIRWVGFSFSLGLLGCLNLFVAWKLFTRRDELEKVFLAESEIQEEKFAWNEIFGLFMIGLASAIFMGFYLKYSYQILFPHRENFAVCTASLLFLLAMGVQIQRFFKLNVIQLLSLGLFSFVCVYAMSDRVLWAYRELDYLLPSGFYLLRTFLFTLGLGLPYLFLGATLAAILQGRSGIARTSGQALLFSGLGNVLGFALYVFWIHMSFDFFVGGLFVLGAILLAFLAFFPSRGKVLDIGVLLLAMAFIPFLLKQSEDKLYLVYDPAPPEAEVIHYKHASDSIAYVRKSVPSYIVYNGHPSIYVTGNEGINRNEVLAGVVPGVLDQGKERALVLGLGTGITAGATAYFFQETDVVEINKSFIDMAREIPSLNFHVTRKGEVSVLEKDARVFLQNTEKTYDSILSTVASPAYFAAGKIYTEEFLRLAKSKLSPKGYYHTWFGPVEMSNRGVRILLSTISDVFERCAMNVLTRRYYLLSCRDEPIDLPSPKEVHLPKDLLATMKRINGLTAEEYVASSFVSSNIFQKRKYEKNPNQDDFPRLEFALMGETKIMRGDPAVMYDLPVSEPQFYNLLGPEEASRETRLLRAMTLSQTHMDMFNRLYGAYLNENPEEKREFLQRTLGKIKGEVEKVLSIQKRMGPVKEIRRKVKKEGQSRGR